MSLPRASLAGLAVILASALPAVAADNTTPSPHFGHKVSEADLAFWDRSIQPDGRNLPKGSGSAREGKKVFEERCATCHGADGNSSPFHLPALTGGVGSLATAHPRMTTGSFWPYATTVFDYVRRAMPYDAPKSLSASEVYAVTAYLLNQSGIITEDKVLNEKTLPKVKMPNRDGFIRKDKDLD
jgi:S-disulfanyl-L-cysteine oxidoreductase SoxD